MIYRNGYFKEELKKSYLDTGTGGIKLIIVCLLVALFSLAFNAILTTLSDTVVGDTFASLCSKSFFSVGMALNDLILVFFVFYLTSAYMTATFAEINQNRWYMLVKSGYKTAYMIFVKQITTVIMLILLYTLSFVLCFVLASLLRFGLSLSSMLPLYITGLLQLSALTTTMMTCSLFIKTKSGNVGVCIVTLAVMFITAAATGFVSKTNYSSGMTFQTLFSGPTSIYTYFLIAVGSLNVVISVAIAARKSHYYHTRGGKMENIVVIDYKTQKAERADGVSGGEVAGKVFKRAVLALFVLVLVMGVAANVGLIVMGASSGGEDFTIMGATPYVFDSQTMADDINRNDFIVFSPVAESEKIAVGDIVLYTDGKDKQIRKVVSVDGDTLTVDISKYPDGVAKDEYKVEIDASKVKGVMSFRSRWLGAWLVFNNSWVGKAFTLVVPLLIVAFYDKLSKLVKTFVKRLG